MRDNLRKLDRNAQQEIVRRVFPEMPAEALDIPYLMEDHKNVPELRLGACPGAYDFMGIKHPHAYNYGWDTRRVSALRTLLKAHPDRVCVASGKSAYLADMAAKLAGGGNLRLSDPDGSDIDIPGIELVRNLPDTPFD